MKIDQQQEEYTPGQRLVLGGLRWIAMMASLFAFMRFLLLPYKRKKDGCVHVGFHNS